MIHLNTIKLDESFFKQEERDGFLVSEKMKAVWAVELDLLKKFIGVCEENDLTYYAEAGTLLGAARHGGFIPWDDDVDVTMPRDDYNKLCKIAKWYFAEPYFFQTEDTDPGSVRGHAQLRNSKTTGILIGEKGKKYKFNQGIFLDIFPLDKLPEAKERKGFWTELHSLRKDSYSYAEEVTRKSYVSGNIYYELFERTVQKYNNASAKKIGMISYSIDKRHNIRDARDYSGRLELPFENITIKVPVGYKNVLRQLYGIWKEYEMGVSGHGGVFFDVEKSYLEYIK